LILVEKKVSKVKLDQFLYIPIKDNSIEPGDEVVVEIYSKGKLVRRSRYTVLEKEICRKLKFKEKCYRYKYILVQLPWFSRIRAEGGDPRDLRIIVYLSKQIRGSSVNLSKGKL